ncbi:TIGR02452 family protein [Brevibacillus sp. DP1.3A]|uniref:TIGR02452 family protein n=1 Tax=Brevibacillus sp. DP1.3A TaxID=2738867 RepID=UPI00156B0175|nr:TIGR02452 family protein [Brevibacillus sp. DP1.3A]UED73628.1 TIGR02452 family protein [Brevibacillus sp. DP1.3A]
MNQGHNRSVRVRIAQETLQIIEQGYYVNKAGEKKSITENLASAVSQSVLYRPNDLAADTVPLPSHQTTAAKLRAKVEVTSESSLDAAKRLIVHEKRADAVCLNFASAKNPGGGFLGGSQAQEESLARSSGLYLCIVQMEEMYTYHRQLKTCFYSDYMIYSPRVPVLRDQSDQLLNDPYLLSFITAPAVNAGVVREREPENIVKIGPVMKERIRKILRTAAIHNHRTIILGAYGCGVFRNKAEDVADYFATVLIEEQYAQLFDHIIFAVYDNSARQENLRAFKERFA